MAAETIYPAAPTVSAASIGLGELRHFNPVTESVGARCDSADMEILVSAASGLIAALLGAYVSWRLSTRTLVANEARAIKREVAADLSAPLRDLRTLARMWGRVETKQDSVSSAFNAWADAIDRRAHLLPPGWAHLRRSIRAAVGTIFGGVAFSDIRPNERDTELSEPDFLWQDFADDYLTYIIDGLARWGHGQQVPKRIHDFDTWLTVTGRTCTAA